MGTDTDESAIYDFLLTIHSDHEPSSYHFGDKRGDFSQKSQIFSNIITNKTSQNHNP